MNPCPCGYTNTRSPSFGFEEKIVKTLNYSIKFLTIQVNINFNSFSII